MSDGEDWKYAEAEPVVPEPRTPVEWVLREKRRAAARKVGERLYEQVLAELRRTIYVPTYVNRRS